MRIKLSNPAYSDKLKPSSDLSIAGGCTMVAVHDSRERARNREGTITACRYRLSIVDVMFLA